MIGDKSSLVVVVKQGCSVLNESTPTESNFALQSNPMVYSARHGPHFAKTGSRANRKGESSSIDYPIQFISKLCVRKYKE